MAMPVMGPVCESPDTIPPRVADRVGAAGAVTAQFPA